MALTSTEGEVEFQPQPNGPTYRTWWKAIGDLHDKTKVPLVILHGGPGACHDYLLPLTDLATDHGIPLLFYDQIGNGRSTHLPEKNGDESFWTESLFRAELDNLLDRLGIRPAAGGGGAAASKRFDLYGHSWGGMFGAGYAALDPPGLRRLVISSSPASMETWKEGVAELRSRLPRDVQDTLDRCEQRKDFESKQYEAAVEVFYKRHLCIKEPWPAPEVEAALGWFAKDPTTYGTMYGPSELYITGSLRDWSCIEALPNIKVPTLVINAVHDEAQDVCVRPFFRHIPKVKWITLDDASHFAHVDQRERYMRHLGDFLVY